MSNTEFKSITFSGWTSSGGCVPITTTIVGYLGTLCKKHIYKTVCYSDNFKTYSYKQCINCGKIKKP